MVLIISAGGNHTCARILGGGLQCWGSNANGQLGDGTLVDKNKASTSVSGTGVVTAVDTGLSHTCAINLTGQLFCWGLDTSGQLGNGTTGIANNPAPIDITTSGPVNSISLGDSHTSALISGGQVQSWGDNTNYQLGMDSPSMQASPVNNPIAKMAGTYSYDPNHAHAVTAVSNGNRYTYDPDGNMVCRFENGFRYNQVFDAENRMVIIGDSRLRYARSHKGTMWRLEAASGEQTLNTACPGADTLATSGVLATTQFVYDGDGTLVKPRSPTASGCPIPQGDDVAASLYKERTGTCEGASGDQRSDQRQRRGNGMHGVFSLRHFVEHVGKGAM